MLVFAAMNKLTCQHLLKASDPNISFQLNADGTAKSLSMATLVYHNWKRVNDHQVIITIESIGSHSSSIDKELYEIKYLDNKQLILSYIQDSSAETFYEEVYIRK